MTKDQNQRVEATDDQRRLADALRTSRENRKKWEAVEKQVTEALKTSVGATDITLVTSHGDEVASITESAPTTRFNYKQYFEDHPAERAILEADYVQSVGTSVRVTTNWTEVSTSVRVTTKWTEVS